MIFADEAIYSSKLNDQKVWALPGPVPPALAMQKVEFKAIAATAGINREGEVVAY